MKKLLAATFAITALSAWADDAALITETKMTALAIPPKLLQMVQDEIDKGSYHGAMPVYAPVLTPPVLPAVRTTSAPVRAPANTPIIAPTPAQNRSPFQLRLNAPVIAPISAPNASPRPTPKILLFK